MATITWLAEELRRAGLNVVEHANWRDHARPGDWEPRFIVVHATAAPRTQSDSAQVAIVRDGRSDLRGPIANATVDRQGRWHVLSAGRCNTTVAGTAGPFAGLGNTNALGIEACNDNGLASPAEPWPAVQYEAYYRGVAAICKRMGWPASRAVGHREHTPGHKTDPTFSMTRFREDVAAAMKGDDMTKAEFHAWLTEWATTGAGDKLPAPGAPEANPNWTLTTYLQNIYTAATSARGYSAEAKDGVPRVLAAVQAGTVDVHELAAALAPAVAGHVLAQLPPGGQVSQAVVINAVKAAFAQAFPPPAQ